jgi:hypothetical protein
LILYENKIIHSESFGSLSDAKDRAVQLANEYYCKDGIEEFGKVRLDTFNEMQEYYRSDSYLNSGDDAHICIEEVVPKDSP